MVSQSLLDKRSIAPKKHRNSIVKGDFPSFPSVYRGSKVFKINMVLCVFLATAVIMSMTSYLCVLAKESELKKLHISTNKINYEDIELQNKVEYLKSFYTIDNKVQKIDFLQKADKILEVKAENSPPIVTTAKNKEKITVVPGF